MRQRALLALAGSLRLRRRLAAGTYRIESLAVDSAGVVKGRYGRANFRRLRVRR